jgi:hypothetical protein
MVSLHDSVVGESTAPLVRIRIRLLSVMMIQIKLFTFVLILLIKMIRIRNLVLNPYIRSSANSLNSFTSVAVRHHFVSDPDLDPISKSITVSVQHPAVTTEQ